MPDIVYYGQKARRNVMTQKGDTWDTMSQREQKLNSSSENNIKIFYCTDAFFGSPGAVMAIVRALTKGEAIEKIEKKTRLCGRRVSPDSVHEMSKDKDLLFISDERGAGVADRLNR